MHSPTSFRKLDSLLMRLEQNLTFLSTLTKFQVVPPHLILHMFKVCLDDFSGTNVDNLAILLEGCGRFLLRSADTKERFATMVCTSTLCFLRAFTNGALVGVDEAETKPPTL